MKRIISLILVLAMSACLMAGCGSSKSAGEESSVPSSETLSEASKETETAESAEKEETEAQETTEKAAESAAENEAETETVEGYGPLCFVSNDFAFGILDLVDDVIANIGEPVDSFAAASCAYQGDDYFYYYDGFEFTANLIDDQEKIISITMDDDTVELPQGVCIGMEIQEALDLINESLGGSADDVRYEQNNAIYTFTYGICTLMIQEGNDATVKSIQFVRADN